MGAHFLATVDSFFGAGLLGTSLGLVIYGVTLVQAFHFYSRQKSTKDPIWLLCMIAAVMIAETIHVAFCVTFVYQLTVTGWGVPATLVVLNRFVIWQVAVGDVVTTLIQGLYAHRIYLLSKKWWLPIPVVLTVILQFVFAMIFTHESDKLEFYPTTFAGHKLLEVSVSVALALDVVGDILIMGIITYLLWDMRGSVARTQKLIFSLIAWTVNSGLLTSIASIGSLATWLTFPTSLIYPAFFIVACRLYVASFLSMLNSRVTSQTSGGAYKETTQQQSQNIHMSNMNSRINVKVTRSHMTDGTYAGSGNVTASYQDNDVLKPSNSDYV